VTESTPSLGTAVVRNGVLLGLFAALTTALIAGIYLGTKEQIVAAERAAEARQLLEIMPETLHNNSLVDDSFSIEDSNGLLGLREARRGYIAKVDDRVVGVILPATARDGYSGDIRLLIGVLADGRVAGVRVVSHRETPGLGDAIDLRKSPWVLGFNDRSLNSPPPRDWTVKKDGGAFDQFTGATITPRAVVDATRKALEYARLNRAQWYGENHSNDGHATRNEEPTT
jgi:electron transport complex protein RnfG